MRHVSYKNICKNPYDIGLRSNNYNNVIWNVEPLLFEFPFHRNFAFERFLAIHGTHWSNSRYRNDNLRLHERHLFESNNQTLYKRQIVRKSSNPSPRTIPRKFSRFGLSAPYSWNIILCFRTFRYLLKYVLFEFSCISIRHWFMESIVRILTLGLSASHSWKKITDSNNLSDCSKRQFPLLFLPLEKYALLMLVPYSSLK